MMLRRRKLSLFLSTAFLSSNLLFAHPVIAQDGDDTLWMQLDLNQDGWLDGRELSKDLLKFDADGDKEVTRAEFLAGRNRERTGPVAPPSPPKIEPRIAPPPASPGDAPAPPPISTVLKRLLSQKENPQPTKPQPSKPQSNVTKSTNTQPILGKMDQGKPVGFFYMQKYWFATRSLENACWYFTPDGRFYQNLTTGFSEQDLAQHKGPRGTFEIKGSNLTFNWSDGKSTTSELELTETGFNWDTGSYLPIEPFQSKSIAGEYSGGTSSSFSGTYAAVAKTMRLNADGTFELTGIASFRTEADTSRGTKSEPLASGSSDYAGKWVHDGFYLTLTSKSGETQRHIVFPFDVTEDETYPERLFMSGIMYKKL